MTYRRKVTIGAATLYLADAYAHLPTLGRFDGLVMDPPYKIRMEGGGKFRKARPHFNMVIEQKLTEGFRHEIINPLLCGAVVVFCHNDQMAKLSSYLEGNFQRLAVLFWEKTNPLPVANKNYRPDMEIFFHAWHEGFHPVGTLQDKARKILAHGGKIKDRTPEGEEPHATVKPDAVMDKIMRNVNGHRICDPFMGTGSTGVAALKAGKEFVGIELDDAHFETAIRRIKAYYEGQEKEYGCASYHDECGPVAAQCGGGSRPDRGDADSQRHHPAGGADLPIGRLL